jgi:hypothetical protein
MHVQIPPGRFVPLLLTVAVLASGGAYAVPQRLECLLTDADAQIGVERRSIAIIFDEDAATMQWQEAGRIRILTNVSISMTSMSGGEADVTLGVSRSSWRVVLQTYRKGSVRTEFGVCAIRAPQPPFTGSSIR